MGEVAKGLLGQHDFECLTPTFNAQSRQATSRTAIFNLVCTIVGGGTLSIPYAFCKSGIALSVIMLVIVASVSYFTGYLLISCARRSGGETYEDVAEHAFGKPARFLTAFLVWSVTFLSAVAYIALMTDLVPVLVAGAIGKPVDTQLQLICPAVLLVLVFPLCCMDNLAALKHTCILSLASIGVLSLAVGYKALDTNIPNPQRWSDMRWFPADYHGALEAFPILSIAFLCHFNVLPMNSELNRPTRKRLRSVLKTTCGVCVVLYCLVGVLGYAYALDATKGDILSNFAVDDWVMNVGRLGLSLTVTFNFPLLMLPCRLSCLKMIAMIPGRTEASPSSSSSSSSSSSPSAELQEHVDDLGAVYASDDGYKERGFNEEALRPLLPHVGRRMQTPPPMSCGALVANMPLTAILVIGAFFVNYGLPGGVTTVWAIMGSSVSMAVAYGLPALFYLRIRRKRPCNRLQVGAWATLMASVVLAGLASFEAITGLVHLPDGH